MGGKNQKPIHITLLTGMIYPKFNSRMKKLLWLEAPVEKYLLKNNNIFPIFKNLSYRNL